MIQPQSSLQDVLNCSVFYTYSNISPRCAVTSQQHVGLFYCSVLDIKQFNNWSETATHWALYTPPGSSYRTTFRGTVSPTKLRHCHPIWHKFAPCICFVLCISENVYHLLSSTSCYNRTANWETVDAGAVSRDSETKHQTRLDSINAKLDHWRSQDFWLGGPINDVIATRDFCTSVRAVAQK